MGSLSWERGRSCVGKPTYEASSKELGSRFHIQSNVRDGEGKAYRFHLTVHDLIAGGPPNFSEFFATLEAAKFFCEWGRRQVSP